MSGVGFRQDVLRWSVGYYMFYVTVFTCLSLVVVRMCCHGSVTYRRIGYNSCCGGRGYNSNYYSCNGGSVVYNGYNNYV